MMNIYLASSTISQRFHLIFNSKRQSGNSSVINQEDQFPFSKVLNIFIGDDSITKWYHDRSGN